MGRSTAMEPPPRTDLLIAGGGLAGGLIALALAAKRPEVAVTLIERDDRLGGNHVWSFFDSDLDAAGRALVAPLVGHRWEGYDVAFPGHRRTLSGGYNSIESERFDAVIRATLRPGSVRGASPMAAIDRNGVTLADQSRIAAHGVIDARGAGGATALELGWQKFAGRLLRLKQPHGLTRPVIMDASVAQLDGYRFVYLLPFAPDLLFVEDTYYSDHPAIDVGVLDARIADYAAARGWEVAAVERAEEGSLPIALAGDFDRFWPDAPDGVARVGMAAGLFHPMTGYSLPDAVRTATLIAALPDLSSASLARVLRQDAAAAWRARGYYRLLARLLFRAGRPELRYRILERFYRLDEGLIVRLYSARSTVFDKMRTLAGKPPVPFFKAAGIVLAGER